MPKPGESRDLQISEDLEFQRRNWIFERVGWVVFALIVASAVMGLFGRGLVGVTITSTADDRLSVEYRRFWRTQSPMTVRIRIDPRAAEGAQARIWLDRSYLETARVSHVLPQPESVEAGSDRIVYVFALAGDDGPTAMTFDLEPQTAGFIRGRAGIVGGPELTFRHFVYP